MEIGKMNKYNSIYQIGKEQVIELNLGKEFWRIISKIKNKGISNEDFLNLTEEDFRKSELRIGYYSIQKLMWLQEYLKGEIPETYEEYNLRNVISAQRKIIERIESENKSLKSEILELKAVCKNIDKNAEKTKRNIATAIKLMQELQEYYE